MAIFPIYTVRSDKGQFLGTYRAKNAKHAIQRFMDGQRELSATFRKSCPMPTFSGLTATIEVR